MRFPTDLLETDLQEDYILSAGFEPGSKGRIPNFTTFQIQSEQDPHKILRRLEYPVNGRLPYAILCDFEWLKASRFLLPAHLKSNPDLRHIPLIAIYREPTPVNIRELVMQGIDDCYPTGTAWEIVEKRIEFLHRYKPVIDWQPAPGNPPTLPATAWKTPPLKRLFDLTAAVIGILITLPLWLTIALAIRLESKGPAIYTSKRVGAGYKIFNFFKFRSMYCDADQRLEEYLHLNQYADGNQPVFFKLTKDPRVTRVGRFIRKYSLDELPQLLNVLLGDMSLVGNRPLPLYEAESLVNNDSCERFLAPAGLTGLWQVSKKSRGQMSTQERIQLDIDYSRHNSMLQDIQIILRTFNAMLQHEEA